MKKNKMMRLASALLVAVMLTTCTISGTYAKYTTSESNSDSARVARFGVEISKNGSLFSKTYAEEDADYTLTENSVVSSNEAKVVAPGTTKTNDMLVIKGTPEVAVRVSHVGTVTLNNWTLDGTTEYCPIIFTVEDETGATTYGMCDCADHHDYTTVAALADGVEDAIEATKADFAPNTDFEDVDVVKYYPTVTWAWAFEECACGYQNDAHDTILGDNAAEGLAGYIKVEIATTVDQIN